MNLVALRMLMGDTAKYLALVFGLAFSTMLVVQQGSVFTGLMRRTAARIEAIPQAQIWVMDPGTRFFDERRPIQDTALQQVRSIDGVEWAERLFVGMGTALLPDRTYASTMIMGVERGSKIGLPANLGGGHPDLIKQPDAVFFDHLNLPQFSIVKPGTVLEINERRARVVGIATSARTLLSNPVVFTTYERALEYAPGERKRLTFVLVRTKEGQDPTAIARKIERDTGLGAKTSDEFFWMTVRYYLQNTGIGINFGMTVMLGVIVGMAVAGQTFYTFTIENTKHFGALKAMGLSNAALIRMVLLQAGLVGLLGWGVGIGGATLFGMNITDRSVVAFLMTPQLLAFSLLITVITVLLAGSVSIRRVLKIEPAIVFR
ncbi:MAG TPA: ABC transporter permease [Planctomycetota bacterium]|nr:ABC transporter permease [Planctomycetota bacterium]